MGTKKCKVINKKVLKLTAFLLIIAGNFSSCEKYEKSTETNTIVNANSSWAVFNYGVCPACSFWTEYVYFDGDSIISGNTYKKVFSCDDELRKNIKYEGLMREHDLKTYFISANSGIETLLYDFSLEAGMIFYYDSMTPSYVRAVDSIEINGFMKKRIQMDGGRTDTWIEGMGSVRGILSPSRISLDGISEFLLCYYLNKELMYSNTSLSDCYYEGENVFSFLDTVKIKIK